MKSLDLEQKTDTVHPCNHTEDVLSARARGWEHGGEDERNSRMSCLSCWQCAVMVQFLLH